MDYSQPLATLFREGTSKAHESVEHSKGAVWLTRGELDKEEYVRYLMILYYVYSTLEQALDRHPTHPALQPTYNPTLLARAATLEADISFLLDVEQDSWKSHAIHTQLLASPPAIMNKYMARLQELADSADPSPLLAHSYVRYLGDLSGGQVIRRRVAKAYNLDEATGYGVTFYDFNQLGGNKSATQGDMKKIKQWFRDGINAAPTDDHERTAKMVDEASLAFVYASEIFDDLREPTKPKEEESKMVHKAPASTEKGYQVGSFVAVLGAVCIAHFALVVGGFTGSRGYEKLLFAEDWFASMWHRISGA